MTAAMADSTTHDPNMPDAGNISKAKNLSADGLDPELVIASRMGDVLIKHTVLKADHFPSCHNTKLTPILDGAPNFRKVKNLRVYGVAIPTVAGLRQVMGAMGAQGGSRKVYWQNLREEPLIFINGNPFVVREADQPFSNLEYTGINRSRVEDMEVRLKQDILTEAAQFNNRILVMHENEDLSLYDHWEPVTAADVQTPQEVYQELKGDGYDVDYLRIPVTDEKAPKDEDFEELISRLWAIPDDAGVIFNCQMGRGRTTTGMVIASLLYLRKMEAFPLKKGRKEARELVPVWFKDATLPLVSGKGVPAPLEGSLETRLKAGNYGAVRSLLRALEKGPEAKTILDATIDACGAMQNLREGIFSYRARFLKEAREKQRNVLLNVCLEYLERYYMLIAFCGYLTSPSFDPGSSVHVTFPAWMTARPELRSILMRLLRRNSMAALELHARMSAAPMDRTGGGAGEGPEQEGKQDAAGPERDVVASRTGAVLGAYSILKEDNFPGMQSSKIAQTIEGAPNFRGIPSLPVYGVGMPTVEGITGVLRAVAGGSDRAGRRLQALWVNMREEQVVYINGRPFVLREEMRPLKNMMEYEGIDAARLEAMEERLKKDVLAEALRHGGRILVAHESFEYGHYGELYDTWEEIDHPDAVATPAEVYASLTEQGFAVTYLRLPVTDGAAPSLSDFDTLLNALLKSGLDHPVIFNCQMGIGRTTTGMVIAGVVHVCRSGQLESARSMPNLLDAADDKESLRSFIVSGLSPRSEQDELEEEEAEFRDPEDPEPVVKVWDMEPQDVEEQRSLAAAGYVGVRRVVRLLEEGEKAKKALDAIVDAAGVLINLRVAIMRYRKPRSSYKYLRPELQQRAAAFKKGGAYLERYALLIAFTFYLEHVDTNTAIQRTAPGGADAFSTWLRSRPDLMAALESIHANPGAALAPLPLPKPPILLEGGEEEGQNLGEAQRHVMSRRRGRLLTKRTILKSYLFNVPAYQPDLGTDLLYQATEGPDLKRALDELPIYSVGSVTTDSLKKLLEQLGAGLDGHITVCISDIREELVVYVNGVPFTRRELEMPAAALHHAGVHAQQLEEQEGLLRDDVKDEVMVWGGRILLHKELDGPALQDAISGHASLYGSLTSPLHPQVLNMDSAAAGGSGAPQPPGTPPPAPSSGAAQAVGAIQALALTSAGPKQAPLQATPPGSVRMSSTSGAKAPDDMTNRVDADPGAQVAAFWERVDLNDPTSVLTAREIFEHLMSEGYQVRYRRIPLSRERTPEAGDIQQLHSQLLEQQEAAFKSEKVTRTIHVVLSRTASGSSARFVTAALAAYYIRPTRASLTGAPILSPGGMPGAESPALGASPSTPSYMQRMSAAGLGSLSPASAPGSRSLDMNSGEYRGIMALARLLPGGLEAKLAVDRAVKLVTPIGDILADIAKCKSAAGSIPSQPMASDPEAVLGASLVHDAARQLGLHYLKRYFLLITYRCFLEQCGSRREGYAQWVESQKELGHLLTHLTLD